MQLKLFGIHIVAPGKVSVERLATKKPQGAREGPTIGRTTKIMLSKVLVIRIFSTFFSKIKCKGLFLFQPISCPTDNFKCYGKGRKSKVRGKMSRNKSGGKKMDSIAKLRFILPNAL